jgi:hypothetical protein
MTTGPLHAEQRDDIVSAASICPVPDCSSLVVEYRAVGSVRPGHPEDWGFTCARCGIDFTVVLGELIFQSVPKQWLSAKPRRIDQYDVS